MKRYYGKKSWVPKECPECWILNANRRYTGPTNDYEIGYDTYQPGFHGIKRWFGNCHQCDRDGFFFINGIKATKKQFIKFLLNKNGK